MIFPGRHIAYIFRTILIVGTLLFANSCEQRNTESQSDTERFKLITYNVWYGFTRVPERKTRWEQWMRDQEPDVVSLQELNGYTSARLEEDASKWGHPYSVLLKEDGFPTGVTSRFPIEDIRKYREGFHHGLLRVRIKDIYLYIIHLHPSNWEVRNREIDFILDNISGLPEGSPVILAGDFNTFSPFDSAYYAHGQLEPFFRERDSIYNEVNLKHRALDYSVIEKIHHSGLADLEYRMRPVDYEFTGTFPTKIEKEGEHGSQRRLDYVFVNPILSDKVIRATVIADEATWALSDHLPVVVEFDLD